MMKNKTISSVPHPEFTVMVTYTNKKEVREIDNYYKRMFLLLSLSKRLTAVEKQGQRAFLTREWDNEVLPFLSLWSVKMYSLQPAVN